jgi:hypothetical protein
VKPFTLTLRRHEAGGLRVLGSYDDDRAAFVAHPQDLSVLIALRVMPSRSVLSTAVIFVMQICWDNNVHRSEARGDGPVLLFPPKGYLGGLALLPWLYGRGATLALPRCIKWDRNRASSYVRLKT